MVNMIKDSNSYLLKFSNNGISHKLFLRDRNNFDTNDIKYFINDFESKQTDNKFSFIILQIIIQQ